MKAFTARLLRAISYSVATARLSWKRYRAMKPWKQIVGAVLFIALLIGANVLIGVFTKNTESGDQPRTVTLATAGSLSGNSSGASVLGSVRSISEANILSESAGTVRSVRTSVNASVPAGFVIAELENASQRAAVLQAEGAYDSAVAARSAVSPTDSAGSARSAYQAAFNTFDYALESQVDSFYGDEGPYGPLFLLNDGRYAQNYFPSKRASIDQAMTTWRAHLATASTMDPQVLLTEANAVAGSINELLSSIGEISNGTGSNVSSTQVANLAAARASVSAQTSALAAATEAYRGKSVNSTASVDASVKQALGSLRGAQAQLEKTLVRAPIGGTVNFLPIRVGDYVTAFTHVATVAQNGSLEVVMYVSEDERTQLSVGEKVRIDEAYTGIITSVAPALDPTTHQIEVHVAVSDTGTTLVGGQSVHVALPNSAPAKTLAIDAPIMLPLASVKLLANDRVVFTVNEEGRLVAHSVVIGQVRGNRIEILHGMSSDLRIVTDARGLSDGQKVSVADTSAI